MTASDVGQVSKPAAGFQPASEDLSLYALLRIRLLLRRWSYYKHLESVTLSGSHAKGTDLKDSDIDIFLSLAPDTPSPLAGIQHSLWQALLPEYQPVIRNVSVRITLQDAAEKPGLPTRSRAGFNSNQQPIASLRADRAGCPSVFQQPLTSCSIDLVPARRRPNSTHHTLWQARHDTWLQTDIAEQIRYVRSSGFIDEILALKIWRRRHALRFPSFLMELATILALSRARGDCPPISKNELCMIRNSAPKSAGCPREITQSFPALLHFLATDFPTTRLLDPANSNNLVSNLLTEVEKLRISRRARLSLEGGL